MAYITNSNFQAHPFHLVSPSPWPIFMSLCLLTLTTTGVLTMHAFINSQSFLFLAFITLIGSMSFWFRDVIYEATYLGNHTSAVQTGLNLGIGFFIVSEALFFYLFFELFTTVLYYPLLVWLVIGLLLV